MSPVLLLVIVGLLGFAQSMPPGAKETRSAFSNCPGCPHGADIVPADSVTVLAEDMFGVKLKIGKPEDPMILLHVFGPPYELGRAHGTLLRNEIQSMYSRFFRYMEDVVIRVLYLGFLPDKLARPLARLAINVALDATQLLTSRHTPIRLIDEMLGLAYGANISYKDVVRINMIPELLKASCSMLGAWGYATVNTTSRGALYQLRALDWNMNAPLLEYHVIIVYHPSDGHPFSIFTWAGFIGCVTGYSGSIGISEKSWLGFSGLTRRAGMPWHFVLRDILQYTTSISDAQSYLLGVQRTCPILIGIGSRETQFYLVGYSADALNFYDDRNYTLVSSPYTATAPGVVFVDKYVQPSSDLCMGSLVSLFYGSIDEVALIDMVAYLATGSMHVAIYDFFSNSVYYSWSVTNKVKVELVPAHARYFLKLNMSDLLVPYCDTKTSSMH